ncbi:MAG: hypothetical protein AMS24_01140 [Chlamydiae bacterium SM23_39]|nr:MAG: hypothetical protein AMS24_01140 [Chlamydiae bacterium SM23_39]
MKKWERFFLFFGRISLALVFIMLSINRILNWEESERILLAAFGDWLSFFNNAFMQRTISFFMEWVGAFLLLIIFFESISGIFLFFGKKIRLAAFILSITLFFTNFIYNPFWMMNNDKWENHMIVFLRNIAVLGGLFYIFVYGKEKKKDKKMELSSSVIGKK